MVAYRLKNLEKKHILECFRPIIDHSKLGFTYHKLWIDIHNFSDRELMEIKERIKQNPATIYEVEGIGLPEFLDVEIMVRSNDDLRNFITDLKNRFPKIIGHFSTFTFLDTIKVRYYPF